MNSRARKPFVFPSDRGCGGDAGEVAVAGLAWMEALIAFVDPLEAGGDGVSFRGFA